MLSVNLGEIRKNLDKLIKQVNEDNHPIEINCSENNNGAVLISKKYLATIQKTLYLQHDGVVSRIKQFGDEGVEELREIKRHTLEALLSQCVGGNPADVLFGKVMGKEEI